MRPVPGATVSMPLKWNQVTASLDMRRYTMKTAPALLEKQARDPFDGLLGEAADLPACLERLGEHL